MKIAKAENLFLFLTLISVAYQNIIKSAKTSLCNGRKEVIKKRSLVKFN